MRDLVEELLGDARLPGLVLVEEEELDELPLVVLLAGGDGADRRRARSARRSSGSGGSHLHVPVAHRALDQRVDHLELVVGARSHWMSLNTSTVTGARSSPEPPVLPDAAEQALDRRRHP